MSAPTPSHLDAGQVLPSAYDEATGALRTSGVTGALVTSPFDSLSLTYYTSGNGAGQIQTVQYYSGGLAGTLVATVTLTYDTNGNISSVVKS